MRRQPPHPLDEETRKEAILRCLEARDYGVLTVEELEPLEEFLAQGERTRGSALHNRVRFALGLPRVPPPLPSDLDF